MKFEANMKQTIAEAALAALHHLFPHFSPVSHLLRFLHFAEGAEPVPVMHSGDCGVTRASRVPDSHSLGLCQTCWEGTEGTEGKQLKQH